MGDFGSCQGCSLRFGERGTGGVPRGVKAVLGLTRAYVIVRERPAVNEGAFGSLAAVELEKRGMVSRSSSASQQNS